MNRKSKVRIVLVAMAALAMAACRTPPTTPTNLVWQPETQAKIVTQNGLQNQCIAPVSVYEINGQTTTVSTQGFFLEEGQYRIKAQGLVSTAGCPVTRIPRNYIIPPIEANFEAGKIYYLGMDHSSPRIREWRVVIWKIENPNGEDIRLVDPESQIARR